MKSHEQHSMDTKARIKRIAALLPVAIALLIYSIRTEGWAATLAPLKTFVVGGVFLIALFKLLGWM